MPKRARTQRSVAPREKAKLDQPHDAFDSTSSRPLPAPRQLRERKATQDVQNTQDGESKSKRIKTEDESDRAEIPGLDFVPSSRLWSIKEYKGPEPPGSPNPLRRDFTRSNLVAAELREPSQPQLMERGPLLTPSFSNENASENNASDTTEYAHTNETYAEYQRRQDALRAQMRIGQTSRPSDASGVRDSIELQEEESSQDSHLFDASKVRDSVEPRVQASATAEIRQEESSRKPRLFNGSRVRNPIEFQDEISRAWRLFEASRMYASVEQRGVSEETASDSDASDSTTCSSDSIQQLHDIAKKIKTHARHDEASARVSEARARNAEAEAQKDRAEARRNRMIADYTAARARKAQDQYYRAKYSAPRIRRYVESLEESSHVSQPPGGARTQSSPMGTRASEEFQEEAQAKARDTTTT
ncbi:hypothetical protein ACQKWADRAFT_306060 [Trichoderma austrokoningii]